MRGTKHDRIQIHAKQFNFQLLCTKVLKTSKQSFHRISLKLCFLILLRGTEMIVFDCYFALIWGCENLEFTPERKLSKCNDNKIKKKAFQYRHCHDYCLDKQCEHNCMNFKFIYSLQMCLFVMSCVVYGRWSLLFCGLHVVTTIIHLFVLYFCHVVLQF